MTPTPFMPGLGASLHELQRTHLRSLLVLGAMMSLVVSVAVFVAVPRKLAAGVGLHPLFATLFSACAAIVVAPTLFAAGPSATLRRRVPGSGKAHVAAALLFLVAVLVTSWALGLLTAEVGRWLAEQRASARSTVSERVPFDGQSSFDGLLLVAAASLWVALLGSWLRSTLLAVPAALLVIGVSALPAALGILLDGGNIGETTAGLLRLSAIAVPLAALALQGRRARLVDHQRRRVLLGASCLLTVVSGWGVWAGARIERELHASPEDAHLQLDGAICDPAGKVVWLSATSTTEIMDPVDELFAPGCFCFRVDLESGTVERIGGRGTTVTAPYFPGDAFGGPAQSSTQDLITVWSLQGESSDDLAREASTLREASTGKILAVGAAKDLDPAVRARLFAHRRASTSYRTRDGRRLWVFANELWRENSQGEAESLGGPGKGRRFIHHPVISPCYPIVLEVPSGKLIAVDWESESRSECVLYEKGAPQRVLMASHPLLVKESPTFENQRSSNDVAYVFRELDGREIARRHPAREPIGLVLPDGRCLVSNKGPDSGRFATTHALDLRSGKTQRLFVRGFPEREIEWAQWPFPSRDPLYVDDGRVALQFRFRESGGMQGPWHLGLLEFGTGEIVATNLPDGLWGGGTHLLNVDEKGALLLQRERKQILRVRFGSQEVEVLWPKGAAIALLE